MSTTVAYVPDLMDRSRVQAAVPDVTFVATPAQLLGAAPGAGRVLVDLDRPGVVDLLAELVAAAADAEVVAFGAHVERDLLARAEAAGCTRVLPRSRFFPWLQGADPPGEGTRQPG